MRKKEQANGLPFHSPAPLFQRRITNGDVVVDARPDGVEVVIDGHAIDNANGIEAGNRLAAEVDILIFDLCRSARSEQMLDAAADNPSGFELI